MTSFAYNYISLNKKHIKTRPNLSGRIIKHCSILQCLNIALCKIPSSPKQQGKIILTPSTRLSKFY